jgi:ferredoxin--NADP+ reductase
VNAPRERLPGLAAPTPSPGAARPGPSAATRQTVLAVRRWTDALVSVRVSRDPAFRFKAGHYARLGLAGPDGAVVSRPLSIASAATDPHLDFLCTLVPGGELSSRLAACAAGDAAWIDRPSYGFLTVAGLAPGDDLWMLATGTGIAPFLSILREPEIHSAFRRIVVVHSVRVAAELAPAEPVAALAREGLPVVGAARVSYVPVVTREPGATALSARIPTMLADGALEDAVGARIDVARSRVMTCGNPAMAREVRGFLAARGFAPVRRNAPGQMVFENYWQDRTGAPRAAAAPAAIPR